MPSNRETLIARARELGYADAEIARRIGISRSALCDMAAGRYSMSPEVATLLADLCGMDAREAAARQLIENAREPRRSALERALFRCAPVLGAALLAAWAGLGHEIANAYPALTVYTLCAALSAAAVLGAVRARRRRPLLGGAAASAALALRQRS